MNIIILSLSFHESFMSVNRRNIFYFDLTCQINNNRVMNKQMRVLLFLTGTIFLFICQSFSRSIDSYRNSEYGIAINPLIGWSQIDKRDTFI